MENYKQESQNNFKSKIDYIKNSEVLNSIDTLVTYRDSVLLYLNKAYLWLQGSLIWKDNRKVSIVDLSLILEYLKGIILSE